MKPKVTFLFDPRLCACCHATIGPAGHVTYNTLINGIERRFRFCASCINGEPTHARFRELFHRMIGVEDALERGEDEQRIKRLLEIE